MTTDDVLVLGGLAAVLYWLSRPAAPPTRRYVAPDLQSAADAARRAQELGGARQVFPVPSVQLEDMVTPELLALYIAAGGPELSGGNQEILLRRLAADHDIALLTRNGS